MVAENGIPVRKELPLKVDHLKSMPNGNRFLMKMEEWVDKTQTEDSMMPATEEDIKDHQVHRVQWVWTYKQEGTHAIESARCVFSNRKGESPFNELCFSNVARPVHWKILWHCTLCDGGIMARYDIVNAHQTTRRGPDTEPCFTYSIPGVIMRWPDGSIVKYIRWNNMLNGMPPAGAGFSLDMKAHMKMWRTGLKATMQDDYIYVWFGEHGEYLKIAVIVDDLLIGCRGSKLETSHSI